jgi:hypothetical protein
VNGLHFLLAIVARGVRFEIAGPDRTVVASDPGNVVGAPDRILLHAVKQEVRALLLTELPSDPGDTACAALDAPAGVAICRRCARGIVAHRWRRTDPVIERDDFEGRP